MYAVYLFIAGPLYCFCQCGFIKKITVNYHYCCITISFFFVWLLFFLGGGLTECTVTKNLWHIFSLFEGDVGFNSSVFGYKYNKKYHL